MWTFKNIFVSVGCGDSCNSWPGVTLKTVMDCGIFWALRRARREVCALVFQLWVGLTGCIVVHYRRFLCARSLHLCVGFLQVLQLPPQSCMLVRFIGDFKLALGEDASVCLDVGPGSCPWCSRLSLSVSWDRLQLLVTQDGWVAVDVFVVFAPSFSFRLLVLWHCRRDTFSTAVPLLKLTKRCCTGKSQRKNIVPVGEIPISFIVQRNTWKIAKLWFIARFKLWRQRTVFWIFRCSQDISLWANIRFLFQCFTYWPPGNH